MANKGARKELEKIFGKICMVEAAGIRCIPIEKRRKIKGYSKKYDDMITFHHLKKKENGGSSTFENGALVKGYNHRWIHSLPPEEREVVNNAIRNWKLNFLSLRGWTIENSGSLTFPDLTNDENCIIIKLERTTKEQQLQLERSKKKFSRSKQKREIQRIIDEELDF